MLYRDLIAVAATVGYLRAAAARVSAAACAGIEVEAWLASVGSWLPLVEQVIEQTERRVLKGETVPAAEKLVSLFEPHSDIIVKGGRECTAQPDLGQERDDPRRGDRRVPRAEGH